MGIDDVLSFDEAIYRQRVSQMSDVELKQREWEKQRRFWTSSGSAGAGIGASVATGGLSLIFTAYSSRQAYVITRKHRIIQDELRRRNLVLRKARWRDTPAAIGATLLGMGVGLGVDGLTGDAAGELVTVDATGAEGSASSGVVENVATDHAAMRPSEAFISAATEEDVADTFIALAVSQGAGKMASEVFVDVIERLEDTNWQTEVRKALGCLRLAGSTHSSMWCNNCCSTIRKGRYGHCCECNDDFDLCAECCQKATKCPGSDHSLTTRQVALIGDVCAPDAKETNRRWMKYSEFTCNDCKSIITQGRLYTCMECNQDHGGFDLCINCYYQGKGCQKPDDHALYAFLWAFIPENTGPYVVTHGTGSVQCNVCMKNVVQGSYYHCSQCAGDELGDKYDLCRPCYEVGNTCHNARHLLYRYFAYGESKDRSKVYLDDIVNCDPCGEQIKDKHCYHCESCNDGNYDICSSCYMLEVGCKDRTHELMKLELG